jgi:hypothetical protein
MSVEFFLLLAVFVLLPLIQRFLQAARERDARTPPERTERLPEPTPAARPPTIPVLRPRPHVAEAPVMLAPPQRRARRAPAAGLSHRLDLRRAIVLMAILGPCRAHDPHDRPERA